MTDWTKEADKMLRKRIEGEFAATLAQGAPQVHRQGSRTTDPGPMAELDAMLAKAKRDAPCTRCGGDRRGHVIVDYFDGVQFTNEAVCPGTPGRHLGGAR
jgi:hypothetical protein